MKYRLALAFILLPLIFYAAFLHIVNSSQTGYKFSITGYDPRDLIHGHYLQYRYVSPLLVDYQKIMLCPTNGVIAATDPKIETVKNDYIRPECVPFDLPKSEIKGSGVYRFYIDERYGERLENIKSTNSQKMYIELVAVPFLNVTVVRDLYIGDKPYREFIASGQ